MIFHKRDWNGKDSAYENSLPPRRVSIIYLVCCVFAFKLLTTLACLTQNVEKASGESSTSRERRPLARFARLECWENFGHSSRKLSAQRSPNI